MKTKILSLISNVLIILSFIPAVISFLFPWGTDFDKGFFGFADLAALWLTMLSCACLFLSVTGILINSLSKREKLHKIIKERGWLIGYILWITLWGLLAALSPVSISLLILLFVAIWASLFVGPHFIFLNLKAKMNSNRILGGFKNYLSCCVLFAILAFATLIISVSIFWENTADNKMHIFFTIIAAIFPVLIVKLLFSGILAVKLYFLAQGHLQFLYLKKYFILSIICGYIALGGFVTFTIINHPNWMWLVMYSVIALSFLNLETMLKKKFLPELGRSLFEH